jgi:hypothetical protein
MIATHSVKGLGRLPWSLAALKAVIPLEEESTVDEERGRHKKSPLGSATPRFPQGALTAKGAIIALTAP